MRRAVFLALALAGCNNDQPICLQVAASSLWARTAAAITGTSPSSIVCAGDTIYDNPQAVKPTVDAGPCGVSEGDGACVACLKEQCCAEAADETALVSCGTTHCTSACPRSP